MRWFKKLLLFGAGIALLTSVFTLSLASAAPDDIKAQIITQLAGDQPLTTISSETPAIEKPDWYYDVKITYSVSGNGNVTSLTDFATLAGQTLNDNRGWSRLGAKFVQVTSGGNFRLILATANSLPAYSSGCSADWSCTVGNQVIINESRWTGASAAWNAAGGSLRDYRHMVVNHETGHWLGHGHEFCGGAGKLAPVMQQQSIDLMGCTFNPWPLDSELTTTRF